MEADNLRLSYNELKDELGISDLIELSDLLHHATLMVRDSKSSIYELRVEVKFQQSRWRALRKFVKGNGL
jgi:hypothetical protein